MAHKKKHLEAHCWIFRKISTKLVCQIRFWSDSKKYVGVPVAIFFVLLTILQNKQEGWSLVNIFSLTEYYQAIKEHTAHLNHKFKTRRKMFERNIAYFACA
jgi:hypothetical protein